VRKVKRLVPDVVRAAPGDKLSLLAIEKGHENELHPLRPGRRCNSPKIESQNPARKERMGCVLA